MFKSAKTILAILAAGVAVCAVFSGAALAQKGGKTSPRVISYFEVRGWTTRVIGTMDASGGNRSTVLVDHSSAELRARWSADGSWLGGHLRPVDSGGPDWAIYRIRPDGSDEREVVRYADVDLYNRNLGRKSVVDLEGGGVVWQACWGPAGTMYFAAEVAYPPAAGGTVYPTPYRIFGVDVDTGYLWQVTDEVDARDDSKPFYSAALDKIVFISDRTGKPQLFVVNPDGSGLQQLTYFEESLTIYRAIWSRDGTRLAICRDSDVWILHIGDPDNSGTLQVTGGFLLRGDPNESESPAAWSPDDSRLLINRSDHQIVSIDMTNPDYPETVLVNQRLKDGAMIGAADWSPVEPSP